MFPRGPEKRPNFNLSLNTYASLLGNGARARLATNPLQAHGRPAHVVVLRHVPERLVVKQLKRKFVSCSHCQELGQLADRASDWLFTLL